MLATTSPLAGQNPPTPPGGRTIAFTFDDLPAVRITSLSDAQAMTTRLLATLAQIRIPAIGFVNEGKLEGVPAERAGRTALLEAWLDAGHDLGNHTYSHLRLYGASIEAFAADLIRGERVTRRLMAARNRAPRYFRHPTLNTGRDLDHKAAADSVLALHGYTVAPVTIDNDEYRYAAAYDRARARADSAMMQRLGTDYVRYMMRMMGYYERLSAVLLTREPAQVLLLHANWLNADWLDELAAMLRRRGYQFVTLEAAMTDPAYQLPDRYTGAQGPSWLERWIVTRGLSVPAPPAVPEWVRAAARATVQ
jgi:peptidoglycan/xylan/chitin deacetylase (PgdA/CDA1 family)